MGIRTAAMRSFACVGAVVVLACGGGGTSGGGQQTTTASVTVVNNTPVPITAVYVSPTSSSTWGANQISSSIPAGGSRTISSIPAGTYDLRAVGQDGSYAERYGQALSAGGVYTWTLTQTTTTTLHVNNTSSYTVGYLYVVPSPSGSNGTWGSDQLGSYTIPSGSSFNLNNVPVGTYDLKAVALSGGVYWTHYAASIPVGGYTWTLTN